MKTELKASDLRIGNLLIDREGRVAIVETIDKEEGVKAYSGCVTSLPLKPIQLTEEWLVKMGWGIDNDYDNTYIDNVSMNAEVLIYDTDSKTFLIECMKDTVEIKNIKYVHQLQNLYHSLTGEELTIKND